MHLLASRFARLLTYLFDGAGLQPRPNYGLRRWETRTHVDEYYAQIDFTAATDTERLLHICGEVVRDGRCSRDSVDKLLATLRRGFAGDFLLETHVERLAQQRHRTR